MAWVLLGPMAPFLRDDLHLSATGQGLLTAIPLLGGSLFRPILGGVADRIGGRRTRLIGMGLTLVPLFIRRRLDQPALHLPPVGFFPRDPRARFASPPPPAPPRDPPRYHGL